jgi:CRP/FNR family cyclic AMP-dependent transcriptional regulator
MAGATVCVAADERAPGSGLTVGSRALRSLLEQALPDCAPQTLATLMESAREVRVAKGETIYWQGEPVPLTLMVRGYGAFRRTTLDGQQVTVGIDQPGGMFGLASIAGTYTSVNLIALTDCEVAMWRGPELRRLVAADPGFALAVIDRMSSYLNAITERVDGFLHQDSRRRVVRVLARHRDLFFSEPAILSRSHLPSLVGTSREMTGRVLRELEREGTVARVGRSGLRLLRPDRLDVDAAALSREAP